MKRKPLMPCPRVPRGLLVMDVVWGIVLATLLLMVLTAAVVKQGKAERQLARNRAAVRSAEDALLALQSGQQLPTGAQLEKIPAAAPQGKTWVRVHVTEQGAPAELVGLITTDAAQGAQ